MVDPLPADTTGAATGDAADLPTIDRSSSVPLHAQLREILERMIVEGSYSVGEPFPPERHFVETLHVSRTTVREAIGELVRTGYLTRQRGRGTFVTRPRPAFEASRLTSFTEDMEQRGYRAGSRVLELERVAAPARLDGLLDGDAVWMIHRLRLADGEPIALQRSYLPAAIGERMSRDDLEDASLYALLARRFGLQATSADEMLTADAADAERAALLGLEPGDPLLRVDRTTFSQDGRVIEHVRIHYRADRYTFHVHRTKGDR